MRPGEINIRSDVYERMTRDIRELRARTVGLEREVDRLQCGFLELAYKVGIPSETALALLKEICSPDNLKGS